MLRQRIEIDVPRLRAGEPCFSVGSEWWSGFETSWGATFVKAEGGNAWVEYHGEWDNIHEGGRTVQQDLPSHMTDRCQVGWNIFPLSEAANLSRSKGLWAVGVNKARVKAGKVAVTAYSAPGRQVLCPFIRLDGIVRSVVVNPPLVGSPEPLNAWLELVEGGDNRIELG